MAIKIENSFITEDIEDKDGNKIGEIKFNPNDSRIMSKLTKIINDLEKSLNQLKDLGDMPNVPQEKLETLEDFEKVSGIFQTLNKGFSIEEKAIDGILADLAEIFGKETIELFTDGSKDILSIMPLLEYIMPYVKKARETKMSKYLNKKNSDVME